MMIPKLSGSPTSKLWNSAMWQNRSDLHTCSASVTNDNTNTTTDVQIHKIFWYYSSRLYSLKANQHRNNYGRVKQQ